MRVIFKLRPLTLDVEKKDRQKPVVLRDFSLQTPQSIYRIAARRTIGALLEENRPGGGFAMGSPLPPGRDENES